MSRMRRQEPSVEENLRLLRDGREMEISLRTARYGPGAPLPRWDGRIRFWVSLFRLDFTGINALARRMLLRSLPAGRHLQVAPGFRSLTGRIFSEAASLCDAEFVDYGNVYIGRGTGFSFSCMVITSTHDLRDMKEVIVSEIAIGENVWIGSRATILQGIHIGKNTVIGAGSVVTRDIPPNVLAAGIPARPIREVDRAPSTNMPEPQR